jgi:hypothetical protein
MEGVTILLDILLNDCICVALGLHLGALRCSYKNSSLSILRFLPMTLYILVTLPGRLINLKQVN